MSADWISVQSGSDNTNMVEDQKILQYDFDNLNISFNGCGFLGVYHVGVASALHHYLPNMEFNYVCGASAGAMAGSCLVGKIPLDEVTSDLINAARKIRHTLGGAFSPTTDITEILVGGLEKNLPDNIHEMATGKLHISSTDAYTGENILISNYHSKKEVIDAIVTSTFIPGFSGTVPPRFRRRRCIDGGFSVNQVIMEEGSSATLTVSPFAGDAVICPKSFSPKFAKMTVANAGVDVTLDNMIRMQSVMFPQSPEAMGEILFNGYRDAVHFLQKHGQIKHTVELTVKTKYSPKDILKIEKERRRKMTETGEHVSTQFPEDLINSVKLLDQTPDCIANEDRWKLAGVPLPTMKEMAFDYNPWYKGLEFCVNCSKNAVVNTYDTLHKKCPKYVPDPHTLKHYGEESVSKIIGYVVPKLFGFQVTTVSSSHDCHCDNNEKNSNSEKSRFYCDFHITQEVDSDDSDMENEREDGDGDVDDVQTLMHAEFEIDVDPRDKPMNHIDAMRLQAQNLEQAAHSHYDASRVTSKINSVATSLVASAIQSRNFTEMNTPQPKTPRSRSRSISVSRRNSMPGAIPRFLNPRQSIHSEPDSCPETLENLIRVTQQEKSVIQTYYTDDNGDVITLSVYDISETDPSDILGQDILEQEIPKFFDNDSEDAYDNVPLDFDVLQTRLERERRRRGSGQRSGDSFFEQRSSGDSYVEQ